MHIVFGRLVLALIAIGAVAQTAVLIAVTAGLVPMDELPSPEPTPRIIYVRVPVDNPSIEPDPSIEPVPTPKPPPIIVAQPSVPVSAPVPVPTCIVPGQGSHAGWIEQGRLCPGPPN